MSTGQKVLVGVLVVIVALFVVSVATQGRADDDTGAADGGLVGLLSDGLGSSTAVVRAELSGSCLDNGEPLSFQGDCVLRVAPSGERLRQLELRNDGPPLRVTARIPQRDDTADKTIETGKSIAVAVDGDGAPVVLGCLPLATCTVTLTGAS